MNGNGSNGNKAVRIVGIVVAFLQPFLIAGMIYWAGRVDANTQADAETRESVADIQGQLKHMSKQLDRIEKHLEAHEK